MSDAPNATPTGFPVLIGTNLRHPTSTKQTTTTTHETLEDGGAVQHVQSPHQLPFSCISGISHSIRSIGKREQRPSGVTLRLVFFALSSGLLFGVDLGSIGGAIHEMKSQFELSTMQVGAIVSGAKGGAILGCLVGGAVMASQGRRAVVALSSVPFMAGPLLLGLASSFPQALLGRLLMGLGVGMASVAAPCYLGEVAPPSYRGGLVALYEIAIALGFLFTSVINFIIQNAEHCPGGCWRYMAGVVPLFAAIPLLLATSLLPESPRWLLSCAGGDVALVRQALEAMDALGCDGARERLVKIRSVAPDGIGDEAAGVHIFSKSPDDLVALWDEHHSAVGSPLLLSEEAAAARPALLAAPSRVSAARTFVKTLSNAGAVLSGAANVPRGASRGLALALLAAVLDQACASTSVLVYAQHLLQEAGVKSLVIQDSMAIIVAGAKFTGVSLGLLLVDRIGRRPLLGLGGALSTVAIVLLAGGSAYKNAGLLLFGMCSFILVFCATWGNGYWVVVTEVTVAGGPQYGGASQALSTMTLFATGWVTSLTFVSVTEAGGPWALTVYAGVTALMALYATCLLPEMKGCTLEMCAEHVNEMPIEAWWKGPSGGKAMEASSQTVVAQVQNM